MGLVWVEGLRDGVGLGLIDYLAGSLGRPLAPTRGAQLAVVPAGNNTRSTHVS